MTWITILEIFLIYQFACFLIVLLLEALGKDTDNISFFLCTALISVPLLILGAIIKALRKSYRKHHKVFLAQKKSIAPYDTSFIPVIVPYKYFEYFNNSRFWQIYRKYPTKNELKLGYNEKIYDKNKHHEYYKIAYTDLQSVLNEVNCYNCKHNGIDCNDDEYLCKDGRFEILYDKFDPKYSDD